MKAWSSETKNERWGWNLHATCLLRKRRNLPFEGFESTPVVLYWDDSGRPPSRGVW